MIMVDLSEREELHLLHREADVFMKLTDVPGTGVYIIIVNGPNHRVPHVVKG